MSRATRSAIALLAASIALGSLPAFGQAEAEIFRRAVQHFDRREYAQAIDIWQNQLTALGPQRGWRLLLNLARAYQAQGDITRAADHYQAFVRAHEARPPQERSATEGARRDAEAQLASFNKAYGVLKIEAATSGLVLVRVGLDEPKPAGFSVYLAPGEHDVELLSRTSQARKKQVLIAAGETRVIASSELDPPSAEPAAIPPAPPAAAPARPSGDTSRASPSVPSSTLPIVIGFGATALTGAVSSLLYARAASLRGDATRIPRTDASYADAANDYEGARTLFYVSLALPAACLATTFVIMLVRDKNGPTAMTTPWPFAF